jgi:hypothetical protein
MSFEILQNSSLLGLITSMDSLGLVEDEAEQQTHPVLLVFLGVPAGL